MKSEAEVIIYRKPSAVFAHLTQPAKLSKWMEDLVSATPESLLGVNAPYEQVIRIGRNNEVMRGQVTELRKDGIFSFALVARATTIQVAFELQAQGDETATRLVATEEITPRRWIARLMMPLVLRSARRKMETDLQRLKQFLDRGADQP